MKAIEAREITNKKVIANLPQELEHIYATIERLAKIGSESAFMYLSKPAIKQLQEDGYLILKEEDSCNYTIQW